MSTRVMSKLVNRLIQYSCWSLFHRLCSTYPTTLMTPQHYHDDQLKKVAKFRKSGRVPAVVWRSVNQFDWLNCEDIITIETGTRGVL